MFKQFFSRLIQRLLGESKVRIITSEERYGFPLDPKKDIWTEIRIIDPEKAKARIQEFLDEVNEIAKRNLRQAVKKA